MKNTLRIFRIDAAGCGGCALELDALAALSPERGKPAVEWVSDPSRADLLVITGGPNLRSSRLMENALKRMPHHARIAAVGTCACSGGIFAQFEQMTAVDVILPVHMYIRGCAPSPHAVLAGLEAAVRPVPDPDREVIPDEG
jgi:ech hydrogenase subunit C